MNNSLKFFIDVVVVKSYMDWAIVVIFMEFNVVLVKCFFMLKVNVFKLILFMVSLLNLSILFELNLVMLF